MEFIWIILCHVSKFGKNWTLEKMFKTQKTQQQKKPTTCHFSSEILSCLRRLSVFFREAKKMAPSTIIFIFVLNLIFGSRR